MAGGGIWVGNPSLVPSARRPLLSPSRRALPFLFTAVAAFAVSCSGAPKNALIAPPAAPPAAQRDDLFLDELSERTFRFFWDLASPDNGLVPDRWPTPSFASVAAVGFGLTAYPIGVERGWVSREEARERVLSTLRFLWQAPQGAQAEGFAGYRGFFYHFLDMKRGLRFERVELSTVDTALLLAGVLFCQSYFDRDDPAERELRDLAERLYARVEWPWAQLRPPAIAMGWYPEKGPTPLDWHGYNEAMIVYLLALGSPTHPVGPEVWQEWARTYKIADFHGQRYLDFAPLFGHQYSHIWVDFRGIRDEPMRRLGWDYFENSRRATLAQRAYAIANPLGFRGYGAELWGISACDGPADLIATIGGRERRFYTYAGRGVGAHWSLDDGTVTPTAAGGSIPFAPEITVPVLRAMRDRYGDLLYSTYGFLDALNPTFDLDRPVQHGRVVPGVGWFDTDYLGIDQGPILAMIENYRSELVWRVMKKNPHLRRGLERAGFSGGWLAAPSP